MSSLKPWSYLKQPTVALCALGVLGYVFVGLAASCAISIGCAMSRQQPVCQLVCAPENQIYLITTKKPL
ncbi:hypothetical protein At1D1108_50770 (plasmid) [Agrobacterium tumefaciens]|nr:hypothetical protein At1D1108_50770 [Agrobacterium tumefaciens]